MARDRLLCAATDVLAETGEIEVAAVARRAEVSVGLPYRYFATRTGLLVAVLEAFYQRLCDAAAMRVYDADLGGARVATDPRLGGLPLRRAGGADRARGVR